MNTTIPGLKAKHAIITPACRKNKGDDGAMEEALERLRNEYIDIMNARADRDRISFHIVLTVEDRGKGLTTSS